MNFNYRNFSSGYGPEIVGGPVFDVAAAALPYQGSVGQKTRGAISKYIRELLNMEGRIKGSSFSAVQGDLSRLGQLEGYFTALGSPAEPRRQEVLNGIYKLYTQIGEVWNKDITKQAKAQEIKAGTTAKLPVIEQALAKLGTIKDVMFGKVTDQITNTLGVANGATTIDNIINKVWGQSQLLLASELTPPPGGAPPGYGGTGLPAYGGTGLPDYGFKFPGFNKDPEPEPMSLVLPITLGVGALGLALALKG